MDGAGYFSSLNGDLRRLLSMDTTCSFVQIRSIPIRLRRELQQLGFLLPIEIEQAVLQSSGDPKAVFGLLAADGYS